MTNESDVVNAARSFGAAYLGVRAADVVKSWSVPVVTLEAPLAWLVYLKANQRLVVIKISPLDDGTLDRSLVSIANADR